MRELLFFRSYWNCITDKHFMTGQPVHMQKHGKVVFFVQWLDVPERPSIGPFLAERVDNL